MMYIIFGVVGAILTLVLHELSHAIVVWINGGKVTEFKPWPHMSDGKFYFGTMAYECFAPISEKDLTIAPFYKACAMINIWVFCSMLYAPLIALEIWELIDFTNWLQGYVRKSDNDGGRYRKATW